MNKLSISLSAEAFSLHTIELKYHPSIRELHQIIGKMYQSAKKAGRTVVYPLPNTQNTVHCCKLFASQGVRLYCSITDQNNIPHAHVKAVINPRKLIDPSSSYLGIMPSDEKSFDHFYERFTDVMRLLHLPEFIDDWSLSRVDLCVNVLCGKNKLAHELNHAIHKGRTPAKYTRIPYTDEYLTSKQLKEKSAHYLRYQTDSISLVIYDKQYQMTEENLILDYEKLPNGILRIELQCKKAYLRKFQKQHHLHSNSELLRTLAQHSANLICRHVNKAIPAGTHFKYQALCQQIESIQTHNKTRRKMLYLVGQARACRTLDQALAKTAKKFDLNKKEQERLLEQFARFGLSPIPLRQRYFRDSLPSLSTILQVLAEEGELVIEP